MIRLRNLVESLETKYNLNEAFSEDMPDWFAKRVLTTKYTPTSWYNRRDLGGAAHYPLGKSNYIYGKGNKKNPEFGQSPEYKNNDPYYGDQSLFSKLLAAGISLDTVKIIEGPIPTSENDKRLQPPNIPIFLFDNGVVYIKGYNDDEKLGSKKSLGAYTIDKLLQQCKKFAYIDGKDPDNFKRKDRLSARASVDKHTDRQGKYRDRNANDLFTTTSWNPNIDKSGYEIVPLIDRYEDKLYEIKAGKVYEILKEYEDYINNAYQELGNLISQTPIISHDNTNKPDYSPWDIYNNHDNIARLIKNVNDYYASIVEQVGDILNSNKPDDQKKRDLGIFIRNNFSSIDNAKKKLEQATSQVFNSTIDWI